MFRKKTGGTAGFAVLLLLLSIGAANSETSRAIPPGHEADILALVAPIELGARVDGDYRLAGISIEERAIVFVIEAPGSDRIQLRLAPDEDERGSHVDVNPAEMELSAEGRRAVAHLRSIVLPRGDAAFWQRVLAAPRPGRERPVQSTAPALVAALVALVLLALLEIRGGATIRSALVAAALAVAPLAVWYASWGPPRGPGDAGEVEVWLQQREHHLVLLSLIVALTGLVAAALAALRRRDSRVDRALLLDAGTVLVWSLVVRFGLTTANVLTDGGSGWSRLLEYRRGFGGLAVFLDLVLPDASMWDSIAVPRFLAALSPPVLVLLAHALGARRGAAAFAGLALASWPLHAALYSSDFESGAVVTGLIGGLALIASARSRGGATDFAAGLTLLAFAIWGRPEALVVGLPALVLVWGIPRSVWMRPLVVAAATWLSVVTLLRIVSLVGLAHGSRDNLVGPWSVLAFSEILTTGALLPYWLWLPLPLGVLWLGGRARIVALAGLFAGIVPLHVTPTMYDPTGTYLEFFRYGAFAMPWLALLAGAGLAALAAAISRRVPNGAAVAPAIVAMWIAATPLLNLGYLNIRYGPAVDEEVFRDALTRVPAGCRLIVPDDPEIHLDVLKRYIEIARDVAVGNPSSLPASSIVGISSVLRDPIRGDDCWYFYRGSYCHDGFEGIAPPECAELLDREPFQLVWSRDVEYRSHRLISRPKRTISPWYEPRLTLSLYQVSADSPR